MKISKLSMIKPLCSEPVIRKMHDNFQPTGYSRQNCSISNEFSVDLGDAVGGATNAPVECAGDGDDGDSGDGDPESDWRKLNSNKLSYIYKNPLHYQLPNEGFVRLRHILQVLPIGKSTWWAGVKSGRYPQPVRTLGQRITAWRVEDIRTLIQNAA
ncbi:MAG: AlpA family phage regulatory protein [Methylotenera sp.]